MTDYLTNSEADEDDAMRATADEIHAAMSMYGGSFLRSLAHAYGCADASNRQRIRDAFPEYWTEYEELASMLKKKSAHVPAE